MLSSDAEYQRRKRAEKLSNPETKEKLLSECRRYQKEFRDRRRMDPQWESIRIGLNAYNRKRYAERRASESGFAEKHRERTRETARRLRRESPGFAVANNARARIAMALRGVVVQFPKAESLLGCSIPEMVRHLEGQFVEGMSWSNFGKNKGCWSIDHIKPLAYFNLSDENQRIMAFHYTNCQPMWHSENQSKSSVVNGRKWRYSDHVPIQI